MIRVLAEGLVPKMVHYQDGMNAGAALAAAGIPISGNKAISVDGKRAKADTPVKAGATVGLQPKAFNG